MTKKFFLGVFIFLSGAVAAQTASPDERQLKKQEIEQLIETAQMLSIARQMSAAVVTQMSGGIRTQRPDIPQTALDFLPGVVNDVMRENESFFKDFFVTLYDSHFTLDDIRAINAFYASASGKKMLEKQPILLQQGMTIGAEFGRKVAPEIDRRVREKLAAQGYKL